jgi:hypothetical protein
MKRIVALLLVTGTFIPVLAQPPVKDAPLVKTIIYTPDSSARLAAADLATIPEKERIYIRYLSLYNIPKAKRADVAKIVSFIINSLGTRRKIYIPMFVGGSDETVIRLNMDDYEWKTQAWEDLGAKGSGPKSLVTANPEPYFHAYIEKITPGEGVVKKAKKKVTKKIPREKQVFAGYWNGQPRYKIEKYEETVEKEEIVEERIPGENKKRVLAGAPWLHAESWIYLIKETQSEFPILRADWFLVNASVPPAYYDFLKLGKKQEDFEKLIFANEKLAKQARSQDKAVVITSTVARNNRTLTRSPTFTNGYYWVSHDSKTSVDERQYIQNLLNEKFDATEDIGSLPNGLQAYFLTDGKNNRLDFADPDVAIDNTAVDRVVRSGRSCIICHAEGIRPIEDEVRTLTKKLQNADQVRLLVTDRKDHRKIEDLFSSDLDKQIIKDNNLYAEAVAYTNGLKTEINAKLYSEIYNTYAETLLTKEIVARDLGIPLVDLEKHIRLSSDPVVLGLTKVPIRPVRIDQWERSFQGIMLIIMAQKMNAVPIGAHVPAPIPVYAPKK